MFTRKNSFWCQINRKMVKYYFVISNIVKHLKIIPPYGQGVEWAHRFPCASYEATKRGQVPMAARVWRRTTSASYITSTAYRWRNRGSPFKTLPIFSYLSCTISSPLNPILCMVRHLADWVAPLPHSQHSPSSSPQIPPYSLFTSPFSLRAWE